MTDKEIIDALRDVDEGDAEVTLWEADFLDSMLTHTPERLSERRRAAALKIIEKYG